MTEALALLEPQRGWRVREKKKAWSEYNFFHACTDLKDVLGKYVNVYISMMTVLEYHNRNSIAIYITIKWSNNWFDKL